MLVECPACGTKNRLPDVQSVGRAYTCARCKAMLQPPRDESQDSRLRQPDSKSQRPRRLRQFFRRERAASPSKDSLAIWPILYWLIVGGGLALVAHYRGDRVEPLFLFWPLLYCLAILTSKRKDLGDELQQTALFLLICGNRKIDQGRLYRHLDAIDQRLESDRVYYWETWLGTTNRFRREAMGVPRRV
jgi:hypothetical protein